MSNYLLKPFVSEPGINDGFPNETSLVEENEARLGIVVEETRQAEGEIGVVLGKYEVYSAIMDGLIDPSDQNSTYVNRVVDERIGRWTDSIREEAFRAIKHMKRYWIVEKKVDHIARWVADKPIFLRPVALVVHAMAYSVIGMPFHLSAYSTIIGLDLVFWEQMQRRMRHDLAESITDQLKRGLPNRGVDTLNVFMMIDQLDISKNLVGNHSPKASEATQYREHAVPLSNSFEAGFALVGPNFMRNSVSGLGNNQQLLHQAAYALGVKARIQSLYYRTSFGCWRSELQGNHLIYEKAGIAETMNALSDVILHSLMLEMDPSNSNVIFAVREIVNKSTQTVPEAVALRDVAVKWKNRAEQVHARIRREIQSQAKTRLDNLEFDAVL